ncbi:MAG: hypothetical protein DRJ62_01765 [Thermoprotei archaeon]|nr:MAG: hypothetical protein DRJ62_01765 [Thermoprotei archaeon]
MSEECSDYVDCRQVLKRIMERGVVKVYVTRHAVHRLIERCSSRVKKISDVVAADIVRNVVRDGFYKASTQRIYIWTSSYLLVCTVDRALQGVIVKTVMTKQDVRDEVRERLKRGLRARWSRIVVELTQARSVSH